MSQRAQIAMTGPELRRFLAERHTLTCATVGPDGRPHLAPLWYAVDGDRLLAWTYAKSQKARNLERDPRATVQVEAGDAYGELRGAVLECDVELDRDPARALAVGLAVAAHVAGAPTAATRAALERQAPKRVALRFRPTRVASWDHRKLP